MRETPATSPAPPACPLRRGWQRFAAEPKDIDASPALAQRGHLSPKEHWHLFYVVAVVAVVLILSDLSYLGGAEAAAALFRFTDDPQTPGQHPVLFGLLSWMKPAQGTVTQSPYAELYQLGYWAVAKIAAYLLIPVLAIALHPGLRFSQMGLSLRGFSRHLPLYFALFVPVLIAVIAVSFTDSFATYYPFYSQSTRAPFDFWTWEILYLLQFFALEFFFRGFALQTLRRWIGTSAVWVVLLPYVMIHFGKPMPETFAAILAGVVLGYLALWTRSIWAGFLIHAGVAISMDVAANIQSEGWGWLSRIF